MVPVRVIGKALRGKPIISMEGFLVICNIINMKVGIMKKDIMQDKQSLKNGKRNGDWSCEWSLSSYQQFYVDGRIVGHYKHIVNTVLITNIYYAR